MQLRDELKFSDCTPITGEVVKQNIERALSLPESSIAPSMAKIANVQAEGNTIRIHQQEPDATLPAPLSDRPGMIVNPAPFEALAAAEIPVGPTQFTVTQQQPGPLHPLPNKR